MTCPRAELNKEQIGLVTRIAGGGYFWDHCATLPPIILNTAKKDHYEGFANKSLFIGLVVGANLQNVANHINRVC